MTSARSDLSPGQGVEVTTLGTSGIAATRLGLGLAALGRPAYINARRDEDLGGERDTDTMRRRCHEVLDAARAAGIGYVDTARSYGRAEEFLSSWLATRAMAPGELTVGSKWGYRYVGDWRLDAPVHETKDHSLAMLRAQLPESRALLGAYLRLYQIHSATLESGVLDDVAVLGALGDVRDGGVAVGLSVSGPRQAEVIRRALDVSVGGRPLFATVQATWNLLETSAGAALADAHGRGVGVLVKEALANGRLTDRAVIEVEDCASLAEWARRRETPLEHLALAAAAAQPWVDVALSGAVSVTQLQANLDALRRPFTDEDADEVVPCAMAPEAYWQERSALPWR